MQKNLAEFLSFTLLQDEDQRTKLSSKFLKVLMCWIMNNRFKKYQMLLNFNLYLTVLANSIFTFVLTGNLTYFDVFFSR